MCGILALWSLGEKKLFNQVLVKDLNNLQYHRGPDGEGYHHEPGVALAHRRLSIVGLTDGAQPMFNQNKNLCVILNGEIYNYQSLKVTLNQLGYKFKTKSDTEVIIHAYDAWGQDCVKYFRGMFSFILYDKLQDIIFVARDRLGVKPLFYAKVDSDTYIFSSELKAIENHPNFIKSLRNDAILDYFNFGYVPESKTIYKNAFKFPAASYAIINRKSSSINFKSFWSIKYCNEIKDENEAILKLNDSISEAVNLRMIADVPVGAFLSGGVDSSTVVAHMAPLSNKPVNTFSINFNELEYDESYYSNLVSQSYNTVHNAHIINENNFEIIDELANIYDEPFADSSGLPTFYLSKFTAKDYKVALSGDGADEFFAGYRRYKSFINEHSIRDKIPHKIRKPLFKLLEKSYPQFNFYPRFLRAKSTFESLSQSTAEAYFSAVRNNFDRYKIFSDKFYQSIEGYTSLSIIKETIDDAPTDDILKIIQYVDLKTYLPGDILTKVDRASMANSLEVRSPFLDHHLIELSSSFDSKLNLKNGVTKYVLKKSQESNLSKEILYRKKKGFTLPITEWFKASLAEKIKKLSCSEALKATEIFNMCAIDKVVSDHISEKFDNSALIWSLLMFEGFLNKKCLIKGRAHNESTACV